MWYVLGFKKIKENLRTLSRIPIGTIASTLTVSQWDDVYMDAMVIILLGKLYQRMSMWKLLSRNHYNVDNVYDDYDYTTFAKCRFGSETRKLL